MPNGNFPWRMPSREEIRRTLAVRLRQLRRERGLSLSALARQVGIHRTYLSRYESGRSLPSAGSLLRLADAFEVPVDFLLVPGVPRPVPETEDPLLLPRFAAVAELPTPTQRLVVRLVEVLLRLEEREV